MKKRMISAIIAAAVASGALSMPAAALAAAPVKAGNTARNAVTAETGNAARTAGILKAYTGSSDSRTDNIFEKGISLTVGESRSLPAVTAELLGFTDRNITVDDYSYASYDEDILTVSDNAGTWSCKAEKSGSTTLEVSCSYTVNETDEDGYTYSYTETDTQYIEVTVTVNMDQVSVPSSVNIYDTGYDGDAGVTAEIPISGAQEAFDGYADYKDADSSYNFDISVSGSEVKLAPSWDSDMNSDSYISGDTLYVPLTGKGTGVITLVLNGRTYQIRVNVYKVRLDTAFLLAKGKTKTLKVSGVKASQVRWSSENRKVVSVNAKTGKIKARKNGNALLYASVGDLKLGTVVSVTSAKKVSAVNYGFHIAKTCSYSQAKRMQAGYYDCSSLVWKSYHHVKGCNFGSSSYAPTAAEEAKYLARKKKIVGKYTENSRTSMTFQAGDVLFKTDSSGSNGRYKGIYHAELFAGYAFAGFDWEGNPQITTRWCARNNGYGGTEEDIVGRP